MTFPSYKEIEIPLLLYINQRGGEVKPKECYTYLANEFELSSEETSLSLSETTNTDRSEPKWNNMVQWARKNLVDFGYLLNAKQSGFGKWKITETGKEKATAGKNETERSALVIYINPDTAAADCFQLYRDTQDDE